MADETTQLILGDAAVDALGQPRKRRLFGGARKSKVRERLTHCENCGAELVGAYCANCGQHAIDYRRSLLRVLIDAADSFFNWDTKFLKSLGVLLIRPWRLTNDFNSGRRVRYVHPLRLYLLASIAFFLIVKLINLHANDGIISASDRAEVDAALTKLTAPESPLNGEQRAKVEALRARWSEPEPEKPPPERRALDKIAQRMPHFAERQTLRPKDMTKIDALLAAVPAPPSPDAPTPGTVASPEAGAPPPADAAPSPSTGPKFHFMSSDGAPETPFEKWMEGRMKDKLGENGTKAQLFLETLRSNIPTMMLCCIPLFAFVLKVLYFRQRRFYVEHLVYALHIHTFVYVAVVVITLISLGLVRVLPTFQPIVATLLSFVVAGQVFVSIRRVYRQGWFMSIFKFVLGGTVYLTVLVTALAVTAFVTLLLP